MGKEMYRTRNVGEFADRITMMLEFKPKTPNETSRFETVTYQKREDLRYGTNPHQPAAHYEIEGVPTVMSKLVELKTGKGGLSQTNLEDMDRALRIIRLLGDTQPVCTFHKHINPSGIAKGKTLADAFERAYWCDARSNFGGTMVFNGPVDKELADRIMTTDFFEVILAPKIEPDALEILKSGKKYGRNVDVRVLAYDKELLAQVPAFSDEKDKAHPELRVLADGTFVMSEPYTTKFRLPNQFKPAIALDKDKKIVATSYRMPTPQEAEDMLFAWYICANTRSNGIVFAKDGAAIAIGTGQQERVGAIEQAIDKAYQKATDKLVQAQSWDLEKAVAFVKQTRGGLEGAVIASDGFMPKPDNVETIAKEGVTAVVQPGGSKEDQSIIELANKSEIAMVFTEERCFSHF